MPAPVHSRTFALANARQSAPLRSPEKLEARLLANAVEKPPLLVARDLAIALATTSEWPLVMAAAQACMGRCEAQGSRLGGGEDSMKHGIVSETTMLAGTEGDQGHADTAGAAATECTLAQASAAEVEPEL